MKKTIRNLYILIVSIAAFPFAIVFIIAGKVAAYVGAYSEISILASKIPFIFGQRVRYFYYKATLAALGKQVVFKYGSFCQYPSARIGDRVLFGYYNAIGEIDMGDDVVIGGFVNFISGTTQHSFEDENLPIGSQKAAGRSMITIGSDVWIGSNAVIAASIGSRCVIGAGSVLVKNAENWSIYAGNPAKFIKQIPGG